MGANTQMERRDVHPAFFDIYIAAIRVQEE